MKRYRVRARDLPKIHFEDPTGFWKLVRTGVELPVPGQQILYVKDIRETPAEDTHDLFCRIAAGDPYKITNDALERGTMQYPKPVLAMHAEVFKLPTDAAVPHTYVGIVQEVGFDKAIEEYYIVLKERSTLLSMPTDPDHIVYWAPMPTPPDTLVRRDGLEFDGHLARHVHMRDMDTHEKWDYRKRVRAKKQLENI